MGKFYDEEYNEVEAFTAEELDAKVKEATEKAVKKAGGETSDLEAKLKELEEAKAKVEEKLTKRSEEYNNLKKKLDSDGEKIKSVETERKEAYEKLRDNMITKLAGDDKEYEEALRAQYDRVGEETLDPTVLEKSMKDAHTLALSSLNREFTAFSLADVSGAKPPEKSGEEKEKNFTETEEGKATLDTVLYSVGMKNDLNNDD